jgi:hypothetical protein
VIVRQLVGVQIVASSPPLKTTWDSLKKHIQSEMRAQGLALHEIKLTPIYKVVDAVQPQIKVGTQ